MHDAGTHDRIAVRFLPVVTTVLRFVFNIDILFVGCARQPSTRPAASCFAVNSNPNASEGEARFAATQSAPPPEHPRTTIPIARAASACTSAVARIDRADSFRTVAAVQTPLGLRRRTAMLPSSDIVAERRFCRDPLTRVKVSTPAASGMPVLSRLRLATIGYALSPCGPMYAPKTPLEKREPRFVPGRIASQHAPNTIRDSNGLGTAGAILERTLHSRRSRPVARTVHAVAPGAYPLSQDRRGARWPPQDRGAQPRRRPAAPGIRCRVSGKSAAMTDVPRDGCRVRHRRCVGRKEGGAATCPGRNPATSASRRRPFRVRIRRDRPAGPRRHGRVRGP